MMSRGSFNGPGGNHNRWQIPATQGATHGLAAHAARQAAHGLPQARRGAADRHHRARRDRAGVRRRLGARDPARRRAPAAAGCTASCSRSAAATRRRRAPSRRTGAATAAATRTTRSRSSTAWARTRSRPTTASCSPRTRPPSSRRGSGSSTPTPRTSTRSTSGAPTAPTSRSPRATTASSPTRCSTPAPARASSASTRTTANRLHFYVLENNRDEDGVLSYRVAVRSLDGGGPGSRGVEVEERRGRRGARGTFRVTNTGSVEDLIRVEATTADGWATVVRSNVLDVPAGETVDVPVYVDVPEGATDATALTFTATSETDPDASGVQDRDGRPAARAAGRAARREPLPGAGRDARTGHDTRAGAAPREAADRPPRAPVHPARPAARAPGRHRAAAPGPARRPAPARPPAHRPRRHPHRPAARPARPPRQAARVRAHPGWATGPRAASLPRLLALLLSSGPSRPSS